MNFSSGLIGGIVGDAMKEGPSGLVGGIVGDQIKKDPRGLIGGLAGAMIDDPREAIGGLAGAALGGGRKGLVDTKERIIRDGRIFSRPRFGGPVGAPDTRKFTPDPNPFDIEPEPRGFGGDMFQVDPLDFLNLRLEQNKEVMGPKEQVFPRFADPGDGVLKNPMMAQAVYGPEQPGLGPMIPDSMFNEATERVIPGYTQRRDALRRKIAGMLRGV
jgi:hypothetical protein